MAYFIQGRFSHTMSSDAKTLTGNMFPGHSISPFSELTAEVLAIYLLGHLICPSSLTGFLCKFWILIFVISIANIFLFVPQFLFSLLLFDKKNP